MHYIIRTLCGMQLVVYAVLLQYCCSVVSLLQPANHSLWLVIDNSDAPIIGKTSEIGLSATFLIHGNRYLLADF